MKSCFMFMLGMTLVLPLSAIKWNSKPPNPVEGVLGENVKLEWNFTLANETLDYFTLLRNYRADMIKYSNAGVVIYKPFKGSVGMVKNGTPAFMLINLKWSDNGIKFCCKVATKITKGSDGNIYDDCVVLKLLARPKIVAISRNQTLNESNDVTLSCNATGTSTPNITWSKSGNENNNFKPGSFLSLRNIRRENDGLYWCTAQNEAGKTTASVRVIVQFPPSIEYISHDTTAKETDDVTLFCNSTGNPRPNITWTLVSGSKARTVGTGETLHFTNVSRNQAGTYQCTAANGLMSPKTANVHVTINYSPGIKIWPISQTVNESSDLELFCKATGNPPPNITWTNVADPAVQLSVDEVFKVENINRTDSGVYQCRASNGIGRDVFASANVTVNFPPSIEYISHDTTAKETDDVTLFCNSTGNPRPNITWTFLSGSKARTVGTGETLHFSNVSRNQAGTYQCTAANGLMSPKTANVHVTINYSPVIEIWPISQTVNESSDLELFCNATGNPPPNITWTNVAYPAVQLSVDEVLKVENINRNDSGVYQCRASNGIGRDVFASANVTVNYKPIGTLLTSNVTRDAVIMNLPVTFLCSADSVPPPVLTLRFKNSVLGHFSNAAFTIKQVKVSDQGMYECVPSNIIGMGVTATLNLTVLVPPSIEYISHDATANETDDVKLFCNSTGKPRPNITWIFLNDSGEKIVRTEETLALYNVTRNQAGTYQCTASNGVMSTKMTASVRVTINYKPKIKEGVQTEIKSWINHETEVTCEAEGVPVPDIIWTRNGIMMSSTQSKTGVRELKFTPVDRNDFGDYMCTATNFLGSTKKIITIEELVAPEAPEILEIDLGFDNMEIHWQASISNRDSPVLDYLAKVKEKDESHGWKNCTRITVQTSSSSMVCVMNDLRSDTVYIVQVGARNVVGYSQFTEVEVQTKKPAVMGTTGERKQKLLSGATIDGIIAGVICFCSLVVVIVAIVTQRRPCHLECSKNNSNISSEECVNEHHNQAFEESPQTDELNEQV